MSRAVKGGEAYIELGIKSRIAAGMNKAASEMKRKGKSIAAIGGLITAATGSLLAAPIQAAAKMQATMGKFQTVFGASAKSVEDWSTKTANAMGISEEEMAGMLSGLQDLLVPMGLLPGAATDMSKELSSLAVDLASFNDLPVEAVMRDLMAAMTGSGETMKKYGSIVDAAAVKQEMLNRGMDPKTATNAEKAQARYAIILRTTSAAHGDAVRTSAEFGNQMKRLWAVTKDTAAALGGPIIGDVASLVGHLSSGVGVIKGFVTENQDMIRMLGLTVLAVGGIGIATVGLGGTLMLMGTAVGGIATAFSLLMSPLGLALGGIVLFGSALVKYTTLGVQALEWLKERFGPLVQTVKDASDAIMEAFKTDGIEAAWEVAASAMEAIWLDLTGGLQDAWGDAMGWVLDRGSDMAGGIGQLFQGLADMLTGMLEGYEKYYNKVYDGVISLGGEVSGVKTIGGSGSAFQSNFGGSADSLQSTIGQVRDFGEAMEQSAEGQRTQRRADSEAAKVERGERLRSLRASLATQGNAARKSSAKRESGEKADSFLNGLKASLAKLNAEAEKGIPIADDAKAAGTSSASGPRGTFSAFGAMISGLGGSSSVDRTAKATEEALPLLQAINAAVGSDVAKAALTAVIGAVNDPGGTVRNASEAVTTTAIGLASSAADVGAGLLSSLGFGGSVSPDAAVSADMRRPKEAFDVAQMNINQSMSQPDRRAAAGSKAVEGLLGEIRDGIKKVGKNTHFATARFA